MNPSTGVGITDFSPCSIGNICSAMGRSSVRASCFSNNRDVTLITGQQCGNGIVEQGEQCDCGGEASCGSNPCCDPTTCRFRDGAVCDDSNEECCNNCQLASADTVCRASSGECDPEERCDGTSPICPADNTANDGTSCGGGNGLACASGQCTSRDQQCRTLMGSYTTSNDTYACDSLSCSLSCASPEFGRGVCYGLQQNFLDGTPCGGGGRCSNVSLLSRIPQIVYVNIETGSMPRIQLRPRNHLLDRKQQRPRHRSRFRSRCAPTPPHCLLLLALAQEEKKRKEIRCCGWWSSMAWRTCSTWHTR